MSDLPDDFTFMIDIKRGIATTSTGETAKLCFLDADEEEVDDVSDAVLVEFDLADGSTVSCDLRQLSAADVEIPTLH